MRQFSNQSVRLSHFSINIILKGNKTIIVSFEKYRTVSFASSITKNVVANFFSFVCLFFSLLVKLNFYISFGSASSVCCLLKSIAISL